MKKYYYTDGANSFGPFTLEELQEKNIGRETMIWYEGVADWQPAGTLPELFDQLESVPPPIPKVERNNSVTENFKNQNSTSNSTTSPQTVVVVGKSKSVGLAFVLTFLFGPLGLFYSSVVGGVVMLIITVIIGIISFGFLAFLTWIPCIIWGVVAANNANKKMLDAVKMNDSTQIRDQEILDYTNEKETSFCANCGAKIEDADAEFCDSCGMKL